MEDNPFDADLTRRVLRRLEPAWQLDVVDTLAAAQQRLGSVPAYTAVLLDLHLPDGDGLLLLHRIRQMDLPLVVIILTGGGDEESVVSSMKAGADDVLLKRDHYLDELPVVLKDALERFRVGRRVRDRRLRVLYGEPDAQDAGLTLRHLARYARYIQVEVMATEGELMERLEDQRTSRRYDVLLLDEGIGPVNALVVGQTARARRQTAAAGGAGDPPG